MSLAATTLTPTIVDHVRECVARDGLAATAKRLGVDRTAVMRVCGGLPVRRGTESLITQTLAAAGSTEAGRL